MRASFLAILATVGLQLLADTHEVIRLSANGKQELYSQYAHGYSFRMDTLSPDRSPVIITITNSQRQVIYSLDPKAREYIESSFGTNSTVFSLAQWLRKPPHIKESEKTVNIYYETVDTNETRRFLGQTAKHILMRQRRVSEPGACMSSYETETDGWYILPANRASVKRASGTVSISSNSPIQCRDTIIQHGDPTPPGLAVLVRIGSTTSELLDYSNAPLTESLFQIPSGYKRVDALQGGKYRPPTELQSLATEWRQLQQAIASWF